MRCQAQHSMPFIPGQTFSVLEFRRLLCERLVCFGVPRSTSKSVQNVSLMCFLLLPTQKRWQCGIWGKKKNRHSCVHRFISTPTSQKSENWFYFLSPIFFFSFQSSEKHKVAVFPNLPWSMWLIQAVKKKKKKVYITPVTVTRVSKCHTRSILVNIYDETVRSATRWCFLWMKRRLAVWETKPDRLWEETNSFKQTKARKLALRRCLV